MPLLADPAYEIFAQSVAKGKSQSEAYVIAGYKENGSNASQLAAVPEVAARITEIKQVGAAAAQVTVTRVLGELARIGFADITQMVTIVDGKAQILDSAQLSADVKAAISEITQGREGLKVKFHDKTRALEQLGRHLGLYKENIDLNVNVSLADLVNGSYKLERGELTPEAPAAIEHQDDKA